MDNNSKKLQKTPKKNVCSVFSGFSVFCHFFTKFGDIFQDISSLNVASMVVQKSQNHKK